MWALRVGSDPESGPYWGPTGLKLRGAQGCLGLFRFGTTLYSYSSRLLIFRSGYSPICSGLETEMKFGEVKIGVYEYVGVCGASTSQG